MAFKVAVVGRPRDPAISSVIREYESRASRYWKLTFEEVRSPETRSAAIPPADVKRREAELLLRQVPAGARIVACDENGTEMTSREFAGWLTRERDAAASLVFVVGGAFGLDEGVRERADKVLSLSRFTLTHELARLLLAEQLYRAGTISRGEPYHK
jgi:23S rRNA (pseudouridine1915-N3)-methyltransferase